MSNLTPSLNSKPSNEGLNTDMLLFLPSQIVAEQTLPDSASDLFIGSFQTANITLGCTVCYSCSNLSHCQINKEIYIRRTVAFSCIQCPNVYFFFSVFFYRGLSSVNFESKLCSHLNQKKYGTIS